jgi:hypothetical protein
VAHRRVLLVVDAALQRRVRRGPHGGTQLAQLVEARGQVAAR